jgi:N-methylhydantoinase B
MNRLDTDVLDDNLRLEGAHVVCIHCSTVVGENSPTGGYLSAATVRDRPTAYLGDALIRATPDNFTDSEVLVRQMFCPGCKTLLSTEVLLADETFVRNRQISAEAH